MPTSSRRLSILLTLSLVFNGVAFAWIHALLKDKGELERESERLAQTNQTLYRVLPKDYYTRNDFALAVSLPGGVPEVRDCLVKFGDDVFVFDLTNTIVGLYPAGPNPFVPAWSEDAGFKCDRKLLDDQARARLDHAAEWADRMAGARRYVADRLKADDPPWSGRPPNGRSAASNPN